MSKRKTKQQKMKRAGKALTRYSAELEQKNRKMRKVNNSLMDGIGVKQLNQLLDTTLIALAIKHGAAETDEDGATLGYRFEIPAPKLDLLTKYRVMAEKFESEDGGEMLRIGVISLE